MNYLPQTVEPDKIFRENAWVKRFAFEDPGFLAGKTISVSLWVNNTETEFQYEVTPDEGEIVLEAPVEDVRQYPSRFTYYLKLDEESVLGGGVSVLMGTGDNDTSTTSITVSGDKIVSVKINGYEALSALTARSEAAVITTEQNAVQTAQDRVAVSADRTTVQADKDITVAAKDQVLAALPVRVATFAAMEALLVANQPRKFTVLDDEVQGIESVPYEWDGVELFVYNTLVDPQPTI